MKHTPCFGKRMVTLVVGLFFIALGIAISTKGGLGSSPVSCLPNVLSQLLPVTIGQATICLHTLLVLLQILLLRSRFQKIQLTQILLSVLFGVFIDFAAFLLQSLTITWYPLRLLACLVSTICIGFGVFLEFKANLITLSTEGLAKVLSRVTGNEFGKMKTAVDVTLVATAVVISLIAFRGLRGVREGTIAAAFLVGTFVRLFSRHSSWIDHLLAPSQRRHTRPAG